jgi:DNA-binding NtrC family response regulator
MIKNTRILIIDDDPNVREAYQKILAPSTFFSEQGRDSRGEYELTLAARGEGGIQAVEQAAEQGTPFAVAFVDMKMPGCDGAETIKRVWAIDPKIKIVLVTGHVHYKSEELLNMAEQGDLCFFRKPFTIKEIQELAEMFTTKWRQEQERECHIQSWRVERRT